jgi:precorrin-3B methylase
MQPQTIRRCNSIIACKKTWNNPSKTEYQTQSRQDRQLIDPAVSNPVKVEDVTAIVSVGDAEVYIHRQPLAPFFAVPQCQVKPVVGR